MAFQSSVNIYNTIGIPGDLAIAGPTRAQPFILNSGDASNNVCGRAFTVLTGANPDPVYNVPGGSTVGSPVAGTAAAGGTGVFAGILVSPKTLPSYGTTAGGPLAATLTVPNGIVGSFLVMGYINVILSTTANVGDLVLYNTTTGALSSVAPTGSFTGAISTTTLTVSGTYTGAPLGVGSVISGAGVVPGTTITALGTGTGGTGTYTVNNSQTVSAEAMTANAIAASGTAFVPNATVQAFTVTATGSVAVIKLTN